MNQIFPFQGFSRANPIRSSNPFQGQTVTLCYTIFKFLLRLRVNRARETEMESEEKSGSGIDLSDMYL